MTDRPKHITVVAGEARKRGDIETLLALLDGTDAAGRLSAVHNLGDLRDPAGARPLARRLTANDRGTRIGILRAFAKIGDTSVVPDVYAVAVGDESFLVRITAMETLGALGDARAARLLGAALREENVPNSRWFRKWAAKQLVAVNGKEAIPISNTLGDVPEQSNGGVSAARFGDWNVSSDREEAEWRLLASAGSRSGEALRIREREP